MNLIIEHGRRLRLITRLIPVLLLAGLSGQSHAASGPDPSRVSAPAGDGWQILSSVPAPAAEPAVTAGTATAATISTVSTVSTVVTPVVLPGSPSPAGGALTFSVSPQDHNLRNALDRWLQTQGWQLAWKVDDDLPLEFNATFSGDFTSILVQVMKATNHMRVPTRVCRHTNNVIRVVARAANCQE
jgi:hypothetical protein